MTNLITIRRDDDYLSTICKEVINNRDKSPLRKKLSCRRKSSRFNATKTPELNVTKIISGVPSSF